MDINLDALSLKELRDLRGQVEKAIASFEDRKKKAALAELEETAKRMGFTLAELTGKAGGRRNSASAAKYANPADPSQTWTGRGRKPRWAEEALKAGKSLDDLAI